MMKKIYSTLIVLLVVTCIAVVNVIPAFATIIEVEQEGDLDGNGVVEAKDALYALKVSVLLRLPTSRELAIADFDLDGHLGAEDALVILQKVVRLIDEFPYDAEKTASMDIKYEELEQYEKVLQNHLSILLDGDGNVVTDVQGNVCYTFHIECDADDKAKCNLKDLDVSLEDAVISMFSVNHIQGRELPQLVLVDNTRSNKTFILNCGEEKVTFELITDKLYTKRDAIYVGTDIAVVHPLGENPVETMTNIYLK